MKFISYYIFIEYSFCLFPMCYINKRVNINVYKMFFRWKSIPAHERERLTSVSHGFWMFFTELKRVFTHVELVHLDGETSRDEPSLAEKHRWQMKLYQGAWRRGVTAGGCRNNVGKFTIDMYS